jgi:hypothetical protein
LLRDVVHPAIVQMRETLEPAREKSATEGVAVMQNQGRGDEKASDAELIALWCRTQDEIELSGVLVELNELLSDFARGLLLRRLCA